MATTQTQKEMIAGLYAASFDRAPDQKGLNFWLDAVEANEAEGKSETEVYNNIMNGFVTNDVFKDLYDSMSDAEFAAAIYENALGKSGDAQGVEFWTSVLESKTRAEMIVQFVDTTLTVDINPEVFPDLTNDELEVARDRQDYLQNKVDVALNFVDTLGETSNPADDTDPTDPAYIAAIHVLKEVDEREQTVRHMESVIDLAKDKADPLDFLTEHVKSAMTTGPIKLTQIKDANDLANPDADFLDDNIVPEEFSSDHDKIDHVPNTLTTSDDAIIAPVYIKGTTKKNTLDGGTDGTDTDNIDSIVDPSNTDHDTLDADLTTNLGEANDGNGPIITDIEEITLHGTKNVDVYSLQNVTSTAKDDLTTKDVNEGATISVNIDDDGVEKFTSTTDLNLSTVVANVDGNDIKEVNLIEDTRNMAVSEISNNPTINLTNGEIKSLALDALDNAKLATEDVTVNLLNDKDGKLTLGLFDDNDPSEKGHDGGGFENLTLVTSDAEMDVTLAKGTHLRNGTKANAIDTEADGAVPKASEEDNGNIAQPAGGQDNLADQLNLEGTKNITITGTDEQLDQAVIRDDLTDDATSTLALTLSAANKGIPGLITTTGTVPNAVNLTDSEVDLVKVDASNIDRHDAVPFTGDKLLRDFAQIAVDNDTTVEVNKIGDGGVLNITGDTDRIDDLDIIINVNRNDANNGRLILGGDDLSQSEVPSSSVAGDSTEANGSLTTQGVDANNAALHVDITDSTLDRLDISALLGTVTIDGGKDLNIEDGGLIFDDTTIRFNDINSFAPQDTASTNGEGETGVGFGGDYIDATEMTGDLDIILRDGTDNAILGAVINERISPTSNAKNGIEIEFGSGDDRIVGVGTAVNSLLAGDKFNSEAGDNIDMGAGDDEVIIGVNDTTGNIPGNLASTNVGSLQSGLNQVFNAIEDGDDTKVTPAEDAAAGAYTDAVTTAGSLPGVTTGSMAYDRINVEVYLGEGSDIVTFNNQNSGFLADNNGVRIKDFEAGNGGDQMGFAMFQKGPEDLLIGTLPGIDRVVTKVNMFNNGQVIADSDTAPAGKYIINGADLNGNFLNDSGNAYTPAGGATTTGIGLVDGDDNGANDGNIALISTADIHKFTSSNASGLWATNKGGLLPTEAGNGAGVFKEVVNTSITATNIGQQYETIVLVGETTGTDGVKIFYVTDEWAGDATMTAKGLHNVDGAPTASLVGFLEGININDLSQDNFIL